MIAGPALVSAGLVAASLVVVMAVVGWAPSTEALVRAGAKVDTLVADGAWWRLASAGALHASLAHLALNLALWVFALQAWSRLGRAHMDEGWSRAAAGLALTSLASVAGFGASFVVRAGASVGASAAAYGLLAAVVVTVWRTRAGLPEGVRTAGPLVVSAMFVAVVVTSIAARGSDHAAHLGGIATGGLLAPLVDRPGRGRRVTIASSALVVLAAVVDALVVP